MRSGCETRPLENAFGVDEHRVQVGFFGRLLERYYALFPADRIKIMILEEWARNPLEAIAGRSLDVWREPGLKAG